MVKTTAMMCKVKAEEDRELVNISMWNLQEMFWKKLDLLHARSG
jgi:hypothetical protein